MAGVATEPEDNVIQLPARALPANIEAEAALIGALLIDNALLEQARLTPDAFHEPLHGRLYERIAALIDHGKAATPLTLAPYFEADDTLRELGGVKHLARLTADDQGVYACADIAEQIRDLAAQRRLITIGRTLVERAMDTSEAVRPDDMLAASLEDMRREEARSHRYGSLEIVDALDFAEADIPLRPWIIPGAILGGYTHVLGAPGGSGKSLFTIQLAMALAAGRDWGGFRVKQACKSLIVNAEDDLDEQRRRIAACRTVMDGDIPKGAIFTAANTDGLVVARVDRETRTFITTPIVAALRRYVERHDIRVLFVDPFAETFEGDENDNSQVKWAMRIWRDEIARPTGCAVYLVHHTTKHAQNGAGNADVIRGAGHIVNSSRISATFMPMTIEDAALIGIDPEDRHLYVRYDDAKANQSLKVAKAKWFRKKTVTLENGGDEWGDDVGALVSWTPPDAFDGLSVATITAFLDTIHEGMPDGERWTASTRGGSKTTGRWAGCLLMDQFGCKEAQAKTIIKTWIETGVLIEDEYLSPTRRDKRLGLFSPPEMRPGERP